MCVEWCRCECESSERSTEFTAVQVFRSCFFVSFWSSLLLSHLFSGIPGFCEGCFAYKAVFFFLNIFWTFVFLCLFEVFSIFFFFFPSHLVFFKDPMAVFVEGAVINFDAACAIFRSTLSFFFCCSVWRNVNLCNVGHRFISDWPKILGGPRRLFYAERF